MGRLFPLHGSTVLLFALSLFLPAHLTTIFAAKAAPTKHANVLQLGTSLLGGLRSLWEPVTMHGHERRHLQQTAGPVSGPVPVRPLIYIYVSPAWRGCACMAMHTQAVVCLASSRGGGTLFLQPLARVLAATT